MTEDAAIEARVKAALGKLDATYEWIEIDPAERTEVGKCQPLLLVQYSFCTILCACFSYI